jgi:hypothetical protein
MIRFEFRDIMGRPYISSMEDEDTAKIFAHEMGLTLIGKASD